MRCKGGLNLVSYEVVCLVLDVVGKVNLLANGFGL
jgi:hypothetical protein